MTAAITFQDGFDLYAANFNTSVYFLPSGGGDWRIFNGSTAAGGVAGRFGGYCYQTGGNAGIVSPIFTAQSAMGIGCACQFSSAPSSTNYFFTAGSGGDAITTFSGGNAQLAVGINSSRQLIVTNGTTTWTATPVVPLGVWFHLELVIHSFNATTGSFDLYYEGVNVISQTNVKTNGMGATTSDRIGLPDNLPSSAGSSYIDDLYVSDGSAQVGPARIDTLRPSSDGTVQWAPDTGATNYSRVNETWPDQDHSYVADSTVGDQDLYNIGALPITPTAIINVQHRYVARKDDAGTRQVAGVLKSGASTTVETTQTMLSSYQTFRANYNLDPNTSAAWGTTAVNALQIGQKTIA